jgi:hypothetical protein
VRARILTLPNPCQPLISRFRRTASMRRNQPVRATPKGRAAKPLPPSSCRHANPLKTRHLPHQ